MTPTAAQISILTSSEGDRVYSTNWLDVHKAEPCGKYWCSKVYLMSLEEQTLPWVNLTVALQDVPNQTSTEIARNIEERAKLVQRTILQISTSLSDTREREEMQSQRNWKYFLLTRNKPLHPATPKLEIGTENKQKVVYVPAQPEIGLSQQTIITVTLDDVRINGKLNAEELAQSWRDLIQRHFSEKLWGYEMDASYPWLRVTVTAAFGAIGAISIFVIGFISRILKKFKRKIRRRLTQVTESLAVNPQSSTSEELVDIEELTTVNTGDESPTPEVKIEKKSTVVENSEDKTQQQSELLPGKTASGTFQATPTPISKEQALRSSNNTSPLEKVNIFNFWHKLTEMRKIVSAQLLTYGRILPRTSLRLQGSLKQIQNVLNLQIALLFWLQISIILMCVAFMTILWPDYRYSFRLFSVQAIFLPFIWMIVNLADKSSDIFVDSSLNQWAKEAQLNDPESNRYTLRVSTYSAALTKATTVVFYSIGIYLTIMLLGIDPAMLAGAGALAVVLAFLSRNLLENMLNGILILATDRYAIGDVIEVNRMSGFVENMNLYTTSLRNLDGQLIVIPNGEIGSVINMTKDWSRVNWAIRIAYDADIDKAQAIMMETAAKMQSEPEWEDKILEPASILGVDEYSHEGLLIRILIKTTPSQQWAVGREFRSRLQKEFIKAGIALGVPQRAIWQIQQADFVESNDLLDRKLSN